MITILSQQQPAAAGQASPSPVELPSAEPQNETSPAEPQIDSEWVVGPRQMAALALVAIVSLAVFSSISYLAGKAVAAPSDPLPPIQVTLPQPTPPAPSIADQFASSVAAPITKAPDAPVFADPQPGKAYIQMAAVERGVAAVFAEGLRAHGLPAFVAPGPANTPTIFRVLIGPVTDTQAYTADKIELDKIGLATFMRQYDNNPLPAHPIPQTSDVRNMVPSVPGVQR
jgi:cell division septation protein DedD